MIQISNNYLRLKHDKIIKCSITSFLYKIFFKNYFNHNFSISVLAAIELLIVKSEK